MKKAFFLIALWIFPVVYVHAQTADLAGSMAGDTFENSEAEKTTAPKESNSGTDKKIADDRGIFSFLNFSFIRKPLSFFSSDTKSGDDTSNADPNAKQETPLEKTTRLAEEGNIDAAMTLGYMYLYGTDGVSRDNEKAFHFYELAAKTGDPIALNNLGSLYFNGIGVPVNYAKAIKLFEQAAQNGNNDAAVNLAFIKLTSEDDDQNAQAIDLFTQAAANGSNTAKFMLGYAYYKGFVVSQDFKKALVLLNDAAKAGFDEAHYILAQMHANGEGTAQNYNNAINHYRAAIGQGHVESMMDLGRILAEGRMYAKNYIQSYILFNIASVYGAPNAVENRNIIEKQLKLDELLEAQNSAAVYKAVPSELTLYMRQTFGNNVRRYIDTHLQIQNRTHGK